MNLLRRKTVTQLQAEALTDQRLKRVLGATNLTMLGIGAIIGTGIFVLTGTVAAQTAGPAVVLSFVLAGVASIFAALCYSEFASLVPMAGSAYTYGYATLGEIFAWILGWGLDSGIRLGRGHRFYRLVGVFRVVSARRRHSHSCSVIGRARNTRYFGGWNAGPRHLQSPSGHYYRDRFISAGSRYSRVGERQQRHCVCKSGSRAAFHLRRGSRRESR